MNIDLDIAERLVTRWMDGAEKLDSGEGDYLLGVAEGLRRAAGELDGLIQVVKADQ